MVLMLHITVALLGIILSTISLFAPTRTSLRSSYAAIAITVTTGAILTIQAPTHLIETCIVGLLYVAATLSATVTGQQRLTLIRESTK